jgi:hypothetical protein
MEYDIHQFCVSIDLSIATPALVKKRVWEVIHMICTPVVGESSKNENPDRLWPVGVHYSGNVLLSHNLEMHYHWGCSVSLPCSEWERVGPLRYDHQKAGEAEASPWGAASPQLRQKF